MMIQVYLIVLVFGLLVGSFANVCIWRIPRGESIVFPSSKCPKCKTPIKPWDNVPVLSYLILGGKCRKCGERISPRYPLVEALNGALYVLALWRFGIEWNLLFYFVFITALIVISFIDLDHQIIPDRITLPGIPIALLAGSFILPDPFMRAQMLGWKGALIGAAVGFGIFFGIAELALRVFRKQGMGGGDIKLMALVGAVVGWKGVLLTTFGGSLLGAIIGSLIMAFRSKGDEQGTYIPFGPFLALAALVALFFGQEIFMWYWYD